MVQNWDAEPEVTGLRQLQRLALTTGRLPNCMLSDAYDCYDCPVEGASRCPVRAEADHRSYLLSLRDRYLAYKRKRVKQIKVLKTILKRHKLPLHWENLAKLALQEAPDLFDSGHSVRGLLYFNPEIFRMEAEGVFGLAEWRKSSLR